MKQRLCEFISYLGISIHKFEVICGMTNGAVGGVNANLRSDNIARIATNYPELNLRWLLLGEGEMLNTPTRVLQPEIGGIKTEEDTLPQTESKCPDLAVVYKDSLDRLGRIIDSQNSLIQSLNDTIKLLTNDRH